MIIRPVETNYVHQTWPLVRGYIEESFNKGLTSGTPDYTTDQVLVYLTSGQWVLIVAVDEENNIHGAMTLSFINYPLNRVAFVTSTGGKLIINKDTFDQLKRIAKYHGATKIQAMARPAMVRLLQTCDMVPGNTLMEATI
jgi:hypothetical protein